MAWTSPITFVAGSPLTAAQLNAVLRDNLNEMAPAKATTAGRIFATTGANGIAERQVADAVVTTSQSTTSTTYTDLATSGPAVALTTGTQALVFVSSELTNADGTGNSASMSFAVSGATTSAAVTMRAAEHYEGGELGSMERLGALTWVSLTAGSNTFTAKYLSSAGTATFANRRIWVMGL